MWVCSGSFLECGFLPLRSRFWRFQPWNSTSGSFSSSPDLLFSVLYYCRVFGSFRTSYPLLCWAGHQGMLFLQRRMVKYEMWHYKCGCSSSKVWNPCPQLEQWGLCSSSAPAVSAESCSRRGELETNFESETLVVKTQTEAQAFYTTDSFLSQRGCSWMWPGVMGSKSSLNSPVEPLDCEKMLQPLSPTWVCQLCLSPSPVFTHFCLKEIP